MINAIDFRSWCFYAAFVCLYAVNSGLVTGQEEPGFVVDRATFESWVFQRDGSLSEGLRSLEAEFDRVLRGVKSSAELSSLEEEQLKLAGKGDIKRFVDLVYQTYIPIAGRDLSDDLFDDAWEKTLPLQKRLNNGLFEEGSLFQKVLMRVLSEEEKQAWSDARAERWAREKRIIVDAFISRFERSVPLIQRQREKLQEILVNQTFNIRNMDENGIYVIQYVFSKIDEEICKELFDEEQLKLMIHIRREGNEMGHWLVEEGVLVEDSVK